MQVGGPMPERQQLSILENGLVGMRRTARILGYSGLGLIAGGVGLGAFVSLSEIESRGHVDPHLLPFYIIGGLAAWAATGAGTGLMGGAIATVEKIDKLFQSIDSPHAKT